MSKQLTPTDSDRPVLLVPRSEAAQKIKTQIDLGMVYVSQRITCFEMLDDAMKERNKWHAYTRELLT